jgi:hypothetical protein
VNSRLVHPFSGQDSLRSRTNHLVVTADRRAFRNIGKRHLVALRHEVAQLETAGKTALCRQPQIVDHDRNIVVGVEPDIARLVGLRRRSSRHETLSFWLLPHPVLNLHRYRPF